MNDGRALSGKRIGLLSQWLSRRNGGVFEAVIAQAQMLRSTGGQPVIFGLHDPDHRRDTDRFGESKVRAVEPHFPVRAGYADGLTKLLRDADLDLLHLHGLWTFASAAGRQWRTQTGRPYLISPHGMLDPWIMAQNRWKKRFGMMAFERANWRSADAFHALTPVEGDQIRAIVQDAPIVTLPNAAPPIGTQRGKPPGQLFIYLGRLHPKKNLEALIEAWRVARPRLPASAELVICGPGEARYREQLSARAAREPSIRFMDSVQGHPKSELLRKARFLVLPSFSEGLPMAVLEAWAAGTPVIMTEACGLAMGFQQGAAIECDSDAGSIAAAIEQACVLADAEWLTMSRNALDLAAGKF